MSGTPMLQPGDNPYQILGLAPDASDAEIAQAYRRLLRRHHPDTAPGHAPPDQQRLSQVLAAYDYLRRTRHAGCAPGTGVPITVHHHARAADPTQSEPDPAQSWISSTPRLGSRPGSGRRRILIAHRGIDTAAAVTVTQKQARNGGVVTVTAADDPVEGRRLRNIRVHIPPGTRDGQTLRIPGRGTPGINGGPAGDLHLTVYHAASSTP